ncbi:hypothetical protein TNCV_2871001 [Trichonephila clavipes]|nr:hypothetical protein TNCV_2871001 [Trichonephila clavipes]
MSRFGGLSEERPSVFKTRSKILSLSTPVILRAELDYAGENLWHEQSDRDGPTDPGFSLSQPPLPMNRSHHRCMNWAFASEAQTQQNPVNSSLDDNVVLPLEYVVLILHVVHLSGQLLNGRTTIHPNVSLQPSFPYVIYGPW